MPSLAPMFYPSECPLRTLLAFSSLLLLLFSPPQSLPPSFPLLSYSPASLSPCARSSFLVPRNLPCFTAAVKLFSSRRLPPSLPRAEEEGRLLRGVGWSIAFRSDRENWDSQPCSTISCTHLLTAMPTTSFELVFVRWVSIGLDT